MARFVVVYHAAESALQRLQQATPEQSKAEMAAWMLWAQSCGSALVDFGMPLAKGKSVASMSVTESNRNVCGYSILQAESMDVAVALLKQHPHLRTEQCTIDVHEALPLPTA
jgi:hypothetical protein